MTPGSGSDGTYAPDTTTSDGGSPSSRPNIDGGTTASEGDAVTEIKYVAGRRRLTMTWSPSARNPTPSLPICPDWYSVAPSMSATMLASGDGCCGSIIRSQLSTTSCAVIGVLSEYTFPGRK